MRSPLGASVHSPLGRAGRGSQDSDQLTGLVDERRKRVGTVHESRSKGEFEPVAGFSQLFERDAHFVHEVSAAFSAASLFVVRSSRGAAPFQLPDYASSTGAGRRGLEEAGRLPQRYRRGARLGPSSVAGRSVAAGHKAVAPPRNGGCHVGKNQTPCVTRRAPQQGQGSRGARPCADPLVR